MSLAFLPLCPSFQQTVKVGMSREMLPRGAAVMWNVTSLDMKYASLVLGIWGKSMTFCRSTDTCMIGCVSWLWFALWTFSLSSWYSLLDHSQSYSCFLSASPVRDMQRLHSRSAVRTEKRVGMHVTEIQIWLTEQARNQVRYSLIAAICIVEARSTNLFLRMKSPCHGPPAGTLACCMALGNSRQNCGTLC